MDVIGTATSRDKFFAERYKDGQKATLPIDEIDQQVILKSAYTDCVREAVVRMLGLRGLTPDDLSALGFDVAKIPGVVFKDRKGASTGPATVPATSAPASETPPTAASAPSDTPPAGTWLQSLKNAIAARVGDHTNAEGMAILKKVSTYQKFPGYAKWESLEKNPNVERNCQMYYKKVLELYPVNGAPAGARRRPECSCGPCDRGRAPAAPRGTADAGRVGGMVMKDRLCTCGHPESDHFGADEDDGLTAGGCLAIVSRRGQSILSV